LFIAALARSLAAAVAVAADPAGFQTLAIGDKRRFSAGVDDKNTRWRFRQEQACA
jgi:hypothetical protein